MSWEFIFIKRQVYQGNNNWGDMYIKTASDTWEKFCYTYELPWVTFKNGVHVNKSKTNISRIKIGTYDLKTRNDGPKGWRLELQNTGHRTNIQIHRAHSSMFIQGCILPLNFNNYSINKLEKGDPLIQTKSINLMNSIKSRYETLKVGKTGNPTVQIAATLPAIYKVPGGVRSSYA